METREALHLRSLGMELGEGPVWIPGDDAKAGASGALWFVDIKRKTVFRLDPSRQEEAGGDLADWPAPEHVGWVLPAADGALIAGLRGGPHRFRPEAGSFEPIGRVDIDLPDNRLNDAAVDGEGRIWFGTMDNLETSASGRVYVLDKGVVRESGIPAITITNGPAIAPCGNWIYHVDTLARRVERHTVNADGSLGESAVFLELSDADHADWGWPDGATCDAQGGVWLGFYGGWAARRFAPDGTLTDEVRFPVANVTKVAIGGPDGCTAYATTARQGLSEEELAAQPLAGDLFTFPVKIPGVAVRCANT